MALSDTQETITGEWVDPARALSNHQQGQWQMIEPTLRSLDTLQEFSSVDDALAKVKAEVHVRPWTPQLAAKVCSAFSPRI